MAKERRSSKRGTCLHALNRNRKTVVAYVLDCVNAELSKRTYIAAIEKICGPMDGVRKLIDELISDGVDDATDVEKLSADAIMQRLRECLLTPEDPAPPEEAT